MSAALRREQIEQDRVHPPVHQGELWAEVDGRQMFARSWTTPNPAPRVVLVHGLVVSSAYFVPTAELLAADHSVLAPDQPGFGRSDKPDRTLTVPGLAGALIEWFSAAHVGRATVVANSVGCQVAAELAMRRPDLVERLVLAAPTVEPAARTVPRIVRRWGQESKTQSRELKKLLLKDYARAGVPRAIRTLKQALTDPIEDKLPYVTVPTLVVRGTEDPICTQAWAEEVARLLPNGGLLTLPGVPHAMNFDAPEQFVDAIGPFLRPGKGR